MKRAPDFDFEPRLDEMLSDPVVQAIMARDGVERDEIVDLVASVQERRDARALAVTEA